MSRREWVHYRPTLAVSLMPPAVPLAAVEVIYDADTGTFTDHTFPVIGVVARVVGDYVRRARGEYDSGDPRLPPTGRHLREEGYETGFAHRCVQYEYLVVGEFGPEPLDYESRNVWWAVVPTADLPPTPDLMDRLRQSARDHYDAQTKRPASETCGGGQ